MEILWAYSPGGPVLRGDDCGFISLVMEGSGGDKSRIATAAGAGRDRCGNSFLSKANSLTSAQ